MNKSIIWAIAQKDIKAITANHQIWTGMLILPLILCLILPGSLIVALKYFPVVSIEFTDMVTKAVGQLPKGRLKDEFQNLPTINHQIIYLVVNYMLGSLFLMIPCLNSMMIAVNSFVGEKERRTLETLLFAPITIRELFIGKVLSAFIPSMAISIISVILFGILVNSLTFNMFSSLLFPNSNWLVLILWVSPVLSLLTILINVLVSARVQSFQAAQQLGGTVVLPIMLLFIGQASGFLLISPLLLFMIGGVLLLLSVFIFSRITKYNSRNVLFEKQI